MAFSFGKPAAPAASSPFSFGASTAPAQPAASSPFSFGAPNTSAQASTSTPAFSFGATSQPAASGGLFGQAAPASTAAPSAGLFGSSLFGQSQAQQKPATPATNTFGGLFGNTSQAQPSTGLFGSTSQAQPSTGLFGSTQQPTQGLFGSTSQAPATNLFGSANQQQQQAQPAAALSKTSKFEELPEGIRKHLQEFQTNLDAKKAVIEELSTKDLGDSLSKTALRLREVSSDFNSLLTVLDSAKRSSDDVQKRFEVDLQDVCRAVKIVDNHKGSASAPVVNTTTKGVVDSSFPYKYFKRNTEDLARRIQMYQDTVEQIQSQLTHHDPDHVKAIVPTLKAQHALALSLAANIAGLHNDLEEMKSVYTRLWQQKTGHSGVRDPFLEAGITSTPPVNGQLANLRIG